MSFFQHQARARRNTKLLVVLYAFTVMCIIAGTYLVLIALFQFGMQSESHYAYGHRPPLSLWNPQAFFWISAVTAVLVLFGSLMKIFELSKGGEAVARMLGGQPIFPNTRDHYEKRVLNVVEEMAIASGITVPKVFLLPDENGINAFAAGYSTKDAVIGVTSGCIRNLSRDELQGVIAHEYSHILNGDMRLNIRLVSVLAGIMVISMVGYALWRMGLHSSGVRSSSRNKDNSRLLLVVAGMALYILGYIGALGARMIQSAVSRQREFLADASAVQFTRNPLGISHALQKIGNYVRGSKIKSSHAEEVGHFFFANGLSGFLGSIFSTHPPLEERIKRIDPSFRGFQAHKQEGFAIDESAPDESAAAAGFVAAGRSRLDPHNVSELVAAAGEKELRIAQGLIASIPLAVSQAVRNASGAKAVVLALLLDKDTTIKERQHALIAQCGDTEVKEAFERLSSALTQLGAQHRLPLVELAVPTLQGLTPNDYVNYRRLVQAMVEIDEKCTVFEYVLQQVLRRALDWKYIERKVTSKTPSKKALSQARIELLGSLALLTHSDVAQAQAAFDRGLAFLPDKTTRSLGSWGSLAVFDAALRVSEAASFDQKEPLLKACVACITADGIVSVEEAELIRALADGLECPLPPLHEL